MTAAPVVRWAIKDMTPWFPANVKPTRNGRYRAQDYSMRCPCCWIELEWRNGEWFSNLCERERFSTHFFTSNLRRWRGLKREVVAERVEIPEVANGE